MIWKRCRKKPIEVEFREVKGREEVLTLESREGQPLVACEDKDYIIRGVDGEIYPIKKSIFHKTFDILDDK